MDENYAAWCLLKWVQGYGTYDDIDWAVSRHILRPGYTPRWKGLAKFIIHLHHWFTYWKESED